jgi:hypothetical protein
MLTIETQVVKSLTNQDVTVSVEAAFLTSLSQEPESAWMENQT